MFWYKQAFKVQGNSPRDRCMLKTKGEKENSGNLPSLPRCSPSARKMQGCIFHTAQTICFPKRFRSITFYNMKAFRTYYGKYFARYTFFFFFFRNKSDVFLFVLFCQYPSKFYFVNIQINFFLKLSWHLSFRAQCILSF